MWNVNKTHADITNDLIPCMNPGDSVYSMNVLRYEVYKNIADMNEKLFAKDETFCTEFYPVPEREVCEDHEEDGLYSRNSFGSTVCNARGGGYLGSNTTFVLPDTEMDNGDVLCEDNSLNRRGLLQRTSSTRYLSITSNYDFEQAVKKCHSYYATCISDVYGPIEDWDVSLITNMDYALRYKYNFAADLSKWDVSSVTSMKGMFYYCRKFNADLSSWDVSSVTNMREMFRSANVFNRDLRNWDTSVVTDMGYMFYEAQNFNGDISTWDTSQVKDMYRMFGGARKFNQPIGTWETKAVRNMAYMFNQALKFNQDIGSWDTSQVTRMSGMFYSNPDFNGDISKWDVSKVTNFQEMFRYAVSFNQDITSWDYSGRYSTYYSRNMLDRATKFHERFDCGSSNPTDSSSCTVRSEWSAPSPPPTAPPLPLLHLLLHNHRLPLLHLHRSSQLRLQRGIIFKHSCVNVWMKIQCMACVIPQYTGQCQHGTFPE